MANKVVAQVESEVVAFVKEGVQLAVKAAVAAILSYVVASIAGSHSAVLDALVATPPVAGVLHVLQAWAKQQ